MPLFVPDKVNMNYANMIEEKSLKKTFIIATLVSTLVGTFAASHNLYDRLTQKKTDSNQNEAIKKLEDKMAEMAKKKDDDGGGGKKDVLKDELDKSGRMVRREYDGAYDRLGRKFAAGDIVTENELQKQIILLQQTVIGVLEEALYHGRQLDRAGIDKLVWASRAAREGSLDALKGQYQRLAREIPTIRPRSAASSRYIEADVVVEPPSSGASSPPRRPRRPPVKALPAPAPAKPPPPPPPPSKPKPKRRSGRDFYCRYSVDLQLSPRPLAKSFAPGKGSACPRCGLKLAVDAADMWEFNVFAGPRTTGTSATTLAKSGAAQDRRTEGGKDRGRSASSSKEVVVAAAVVTEQTQKQKHTLLRCRVPAKFVVKCHTPEGDYACVLCCGPRGDYAGGVVLCDDPEALVDHVAKEHTASDIEREIDILVG